MAAHRRERGQDDGGGGGVDFGAGGAANARDAEASTQHADATARADVAARDGATHIEAAIAAAVPRVAKAPAVLAEAAVGAVLRA